MINPLSESLVCVNLITTLGLILTLAVVAFLIGSWVGYNLAVVRVDKK